MKFGIIGCGKMGYSILQGIIKKGILLEINGQQDINDVTKEIVSKLGE